MEQSLSPITPGEHPFRHVDEVWPLCVICKNLANASCPRCESPMCLEHRPSANRRCPSCEREFVHTLILLPVKGMLILAVAVAGLVVGAVLLDLSNAPPEVLRLVAASALGGVLVMPLLFYVPRWERGWRRRFLAQRRSR